MNLNQSIPKRMRDRCKRPMMRLLNGEVCTLMIDTKRQLVSRLNGRCIPVKNGILSYTGEIYTDCSTCRASCEIINASGYSEPGFVYEYKSRGRGVLKWKCPKCGNDVVEDCTPIDSIEKSLEVKSDPLCFSCRRKTK
ncbi:hypothetical protein EniLVp02_0178 [Vibrio phage EniLVp02]